MHIMFGYFISKKQASTSCYQHLILVASLLQFNSNCHLLCQDVPYIYAVEGLDLFIDECIQFTLELE